MSSATDVSGAYRLLPQSNRAAALIHGKRFSNSYILLSQPRTLFPICRTTLPRSPLLTCLCSSRTPPSSSKLRFFFLFLPCFQLPIFLLLLSIFFSVRVLFSVLPADLPRRWGCLVAVAEQEEAVRLPSHLLRAVVASEDRRFFHHFGIDPVGISRAVLSLSAGGGGSTITQQLVKNAFLRHERKFSRKIVEMILALALERSMSKWQILHSYLRVIYWGHRVYGIESASAFYFGKHASQITLEESAMLVGIIPAPDLLSPLRELSRGKRSQARTLRRMVRAGFLNVETALAILNQPLHLREELELIFLQNESIRRCKKSPLKEIWDWEMANSVWEVKEDMEKWTANVR